MLQLQSCPSPVHFEIMLQLLFLPFISKYRNDATITALPLTSGQRIDACPRSLENIETMLHLQFLPFTSEDRTNVTITVFALCQ